MGEPVHEPGPLRLPLVLSLFPLPNVVLFPGVPLPLHVFEPRYRSLIRDAQERDDRVIGIVLLRGDWRRKYYDRPEIFAVGCAGRLVSVEPLADGRSNVLLQGVREFEIGEEDQERSYRRASVRWRDAAVDTLPAGLKGEIHERMERLLRGRRSGLAAQLLDDSSVSDDLLVNFLCYALDVVPLEKQALLEAPSLLERARRLCDVLHFALEARAFGGGPEEPQH